jgi:hypothetical protein
VRAPKKAAQIPAVEVDLHIHQLVKSERGMSHDMLNTHRTDTGQDRMGKKRERIPKLVFIHGVGAGVLRTELNIYSPDIQKFIFTMPILKMRKRRD